ncbi:hypothetical protein GAYE_SCF42G5581 [Galdieria yellowstonensis]|uniref:Signal peptidase complex subunit 1 n=1 Tax=Galdieria yellowstonensis TaxID=3028027 RepID=A0AAV9IKB6_9RHOD|nr:hypothetical protein GAYE_SCF42G5581 [Galdieria yellowstonensis]
MDLQGQATCEKYAKKGILWTTLVALIVGLVTDDYLRMVQVFILGVVLVAMGVLFPWPWYTRHPLVFVHAATKNNNNNNHS